MSYTKRPAVLLSLVYLGALGICYLLSVLEYSFWLLAVFAAVFLFVYMMFFDGKRHLVLSAVAIAAIVFAGVQAHGVAEEDAVWDRLRGETVPVCGTVEEIVYTSDGITYIMAQLTELNGETVSTGAFLTVEGGVPFSRYDVFSCMMRVFTKEESSVDMQENGSYYRAKGIACEGTVELDTLTHLETPFSLRRMFEDMRTRLCASLARYVPYEELSFLSGLVFGDRAAISNTVARDFRRTGTSHMLAVSGTHLSMMIVCIGWLCRRLRIGRVATVVLLSLSVAMIVGITGFSLSVLRAALMWGIGAFAYVFGSRRDVYSALALAPAVLCACDMRAMYDIGLQMSVLCTLGIFVLGIPTDRWLAVHLPRRRFFRVLRKYVMMPIVLTVSSTIFTLPTAIYTYGELSLVAPLANLLFTLPTTFLLIATPILLLLGLLPIQLPAMAVGLAVSMLTEFCLHMASALSHIPHIVLGIEYTFTPLVLLAILFFTYGFYRRRRSPLVIYAAFFAGCLLFMACQGVYQFVYRDRVTAVYQMEGQNESIGITDGRNTVLIDLSNGANGACYRAWRQLTKHRATELDALVLTHYDRKHPSMLAALCERTVVRSLYLPKPLDAEEREIYDAIREADYMRDITCCEYDAEILTLPLEDISVTVLERTYLSRSEASLLTLSLAAGAQRLTYMASAAWETENAEREVLLSETDYLICGSHGPICKTAYGMRIDPAPYRTVSVPTKEVAALFTHTAETLIISDDAKYIEFTLHAARP